MADTYLNDGGMKFICGKLDYTPLITLIFDIIRGKYVDARFTDVHKQFMTKFILNLDDVYSDRRVLPFMGVGDIYDEALEDDEDDDDDNKVPKCKPVAEMADMLFDNFTRMVNTVKIE